MHRHAHVCKHDVHACANTCMHAGMPPPQMCGHFWEGGEQGDCYSLGKKECIGVHDTVIGIVFHVSMCMHMHACTCTYGIRSYSIINSSAAMWTWPKLANPSHASWFIKMSTTKSLQTHFPTLFKFQSIYAAWQIRLSSAFQRKDEARTVGLACVCWFHTSKWSNPRLARRYCDWRYCDDF